MCKNIQINASAPGKVILFGEHAVVYGECAVAASFDLRTKATLRELTGINSEAKLSFGKVDLHVTIPLQSINAVISTNPTHEELTEYSSQIFGNFNNENISDTAESSFKCAVYLLVGLRLWNKLNIYENSFEIIVDSQLSIGAGTGSSASFSVVLAAVIFSYTKQRHNIGSGNFTEEELDIINDWAFRSEKLIHGSPSGIDNFVCLRGGFVVLNEKKKLVPVATNKRIRILLINSHVSRSTGKLVSKVANLKTRHPKPVENMMSAIGHISKSVVSLLNDAHLDASELYLRFQDLVTMNHGLLYSLGVSHPALQDIIRICDEFGISAKLTGAGGGGFAWALLPPDERDIASCLDSLVLRGFSAQVVSLGSAGLIVD